MTEFVPPGASTHSFRAFDLLERAARFDEEQNTGICQQVPTRFSRHQAVSRTQQQPDAKPVLELRNRL
jgi:hypothetical protein